MKGTTLICLFLCALTSEIIALKCKKLKEKEVFIHALQFLFGCRVYTTTVDASIVPASTEATSTTSITTSPTTAANPCASSPCMGESTCEADSDTSLGFKCECEDFRSGPLCEICMTCNAPETCTDVFLGKVVVGSCEDEGHSCCKFP